MVGRLRGRRESGGNLAADGASIGLQVCADPDHVCARICERNRDRLADAATAARDEHGRARERAGGHARQSMRIFMAAASSSSSSNTEGSRSSGSTAVGPPVPGQRRGPEPGPVALLPLAVRGLRRVDVLRAAGAPAPVRVRGLHALPRLRPRDRWLLESGPRARRGARRRGARGRPPAPPWRGHGNPHCVLERSWRTSSRRAERHEGAACDELPHGCLGAEVAPAEDRREEAQPPGMSPSELEGDGDGLVLGEEVLLRHVSSRVRSGSAAQDARAGSASTRCSAPRPRKSRPRECPGRMSAPSRPSRGVCRSCGPCG